MMNEKDRNEKIKRSIVEMGQYTNDLLAPLNTLNHGNNCAINLTWARMEQIEINANKSQ